MEYEVNTDPAGSVIHIKFFGIFDIEWYRQFYNDLVNRDDFHPGVHMIWDATELDASQMSAELIRRLGAISMEYAEKRGHGKTAFVAGTDFQFGTARMFDSLHAGKIPAVFRPFKSIEEAQQWIQCDDDDEEGED
jgi:hypothetical protein